MVIGTLALVLSCALGAAAWVTALRPPKSVGWVFGRGFLGVSAVVAFAIAIMGIGIGSELWLEHAPPALIGVLVVGVPGFLATEFFIGGTLYRKVDTGFAKFLSVGSHVIAAVLSLVTLLMIFFRAARRVHGRVALRVTGFPHRARDRAAGLPRAAGRATLSP